MLAQALANAGDNPITTVVKATIRLIDPISIVQPIMGDDSGMIKCHCKMSRTHLERF